MKQNPEALDLKPAFSCQVVKGRFGIYRMGPKEPIPTWALSARFFSITRTEQELSLVCEEDKVPPGINQESGWRCLRVVGPIPFSMVGVIASLTAPLAKQGVSVFVVSTFDTDYLLVKENQFESAINTLKSEGIPFLGEISLN